MSPLSFFQALLYILKQYLFEWPVTIQSCISLAAYITLICIGSWLWVLLLTIVYVGVVTVDNLANDTKRNNHIQVLKTILKDEA